MVGGEVIGIVRYDAAPQTLLNVRESPAGDRCCVRLMEGDEVVQVGDAVWWQGHYVMWTPAAPGDNRRDVMLPKVGYSFVPLGDNA